LGVVGDKIRPKTISVWFLLAAIQVCKRRRRKKI
jgi:hypothetical protein